MSSDLYTSASGAVAGWLRMETIANNLANANTSGFRAQVVKYQGTDNDPNGHQVQASVETSTLVDGPIVQDDIPTHLALSGEGFFEVEDPTGTTLVRSGRFHLDDQGQLVDQQGRAVLSEGGPIELEPGTTFTVAKDGTILDEGGAEIDRLRLRTADAVEPMGSLGYRPIGETRAVTDVTVTQNALEGSSVDPLREMVDLMETSRLFEMFQKAMQTSDQLEGRANELGGTR